MNKTVLDTRTLEKTTYEMYSELLESTVEWFFLHQEVTTQFPR